MSVGRSDARAEGESLSKINDLVRKRRGAKAILAVVFTSIGLATALVAGISAVMTAESTSGNRYVTGTVVDLDDSGRGYRPVVEFTAPGHSTVRFTSSLGSSPPEFRVGERVEVRYDPDDLQDARINTYWQTWFLPTLFGLFAGPFLLAGIGFGAVTLAARRRQRISAGGPTAKAPGALRLRL